MKVRFEFNAADLAEVSTRTADRSAMIRRWRRVGRLAWGIIIGLIAFTFTPAELGVRVAVGILAGAVAFAWLTWLARRRKSSPRLVQFYRERLGGDGPFPCEVEIDEAGVVARQFGAEMRHPWSQVESVSDVPGGIELVYRPMGSLLVRDRAFSDAATRAEFLALARGFLGRPPSAAA